MEELTREDIDYAIRTARAKGYRAIELEVGESRFAADLSASGTPKPAPLAPTAVTDQPVDEGVWVTAPVVGYFRFGRTKISEGAEVAEGDILGDVLALGIPNDVVASVKGTVRQVLAQEDGAVEYNQRLILID